MAEYAALEYLYRAKKRKALFFKRYFTRFEVIYFDEKFYKKKKWPGHLGKFGFKFLGKGHFGDVPSHLRFDVNKQPNDVDIKVNYSPSPEEAKAFVQNIGGQFEILDAAKYANKNYKVMFTVYNVYDKENGRHVIFAVGHWEGKKNFDKAIKFVENDLRKSFHDKSNF